MLAYTHQQWMQQTANPYPPPMQMLGSKHALENNLQRLGRLYANIFKIFAKTKQGRDEVHTHTQTHPKQTIPTHPQHVLPTTLKARFGRPPLPRAAIKQLRPTPTPSMHV